MLDLLLFPFVGSPKTNRPVCPRLPSIPKVVSKHWRTMVQDPRMKEIFSSPPLVAYRRPANIKDKLIRSKMPTVQKRNKRVRTGMSRENCQINCHYGGGGDQHGGELPRLKHHLPDNLPPL